MAIGPVNSPEYRGYVQIKLQSSYIVLMKTGLFATLTEIEYVKCTTNQAYACDHVMVWEEDRENYCLAAFGSLSIDI